VDAEARAIWDRLREAALAARAHAHAPYSRFPVGAAVEAEDGRVFAGCNVENIAFPQSICAERNAVTTAATAGVRRLRRVYVVADPAAAPCGGCRSVLAEFGTEGTEVMIGDSAGGERLTTLGELLPQSFEMTAQLPGD
jgi:cytidine deaminase